MFRSSFIAFSHIAVLARYLHPKWTFVGRMECPLRALGPPKEFSAVGMGLYRVERQTPVRRFIADNVTGAVPLSSSTIGSCLRRSNRAPDSLRGYRHFDVGHAKFGECIDDGVDDGAERPCGSTFAGA